MLSSLRSRPCDTIMALTTTATATTSTTSTTATIVTAVVAVRITDYGELSELIAVNIRRNLSPEQAARTTVDTLDWNAVDVSRRFPPSRWDVILISDVIWADGYGKLPQTLTEIAAPTTPIVLGFEQRAHKRPELGSPTFLPTLRRSARPLASDLPRWAASLTRCRWGWQVPACGGSGVPAGAAEGALALVPCAKHEAGLASPQAA